MKRTLLFILFNVLMLSLVLCQVNILGPPALATKLRNYGTEGGERE